MNWRKHWFSFLILATLLASIRLVDAAAVTKSNSLGQNLIKYSEEFGASAGWTYINSSTSTDAGIAPDGTKTAEKIIPNTLNSTHYFASLVDQADQTKSFTASVYAKAAGESRVRLSVSGSGAYSANFNLATGAISALGVTAGMSPVGDGWYRLWISIPANHGFGVTPYIIFRDLETFAGDGTSGMYFWGAQVVEGRKVTAYNKVRTSALNSTFVPTGSTRSNQLGQNLLTYSERFDDAAWTKFNVTVAANAMQAPDGTMTADRITDSSDGGATGHYMQPSLAETVGRKYTLSVYAKAGTKSVVSLAPDGAAYQVSFNLSTCAFGLSLNGAVISTSAVSKGDGWCQVSVTYVSVISSGVPRFYIADSTASLSYTGDGTGTIFVWGAQAVEGLKPAAYNPTIATTKNSTFIPTGAAKSSQLGQNLLTYSEQIDNAAWLKINTTISANSINAPAGNVTADKITASGAGSIEHSVVNIATPSRLGRMTGSVYLKYNNTQWVIVGSRQGAATRYAWFDVQNGVLGTTNSNMTTTIKPVGNGWYRVSATWISSAAEGDTDLIIAPVLSNGGSTSYSQSSEAVYAWGGQLVAGSSPAAYNPTGATARNTGYVP